MFKKQRKFIVIRILGSVYSNRMIDDSVLVVFKNNSVKSKFFEFVIRNEINRVGCIEIPVFVKIIRNNWDFCSQVMRMIMTDGSCRTTAPNTSFLS